MAALRLPRQPKSWFSDLGERLCCPDYELYNRVYSFLYLFYRKVTFCNHVMCIKLFIKVNILHNKQFLNTLCMTSCARLPIS